MTTPNFGMQFPRNGTETASVIGADFSKCLVIDSSEDASDTEIPVDTAVRSSTSNTDFMAALGTGLLADQVKAIGDQLDGLNSGADVTVWRVSEGADAAATAAAIADVLASISDIPSAVKATPRIIVAGRTAIANSPVIAALETATAKLLAVAPVDVSDASLAAAVTARETMSSERLMPIGVAAKINVGGNAVVRPMAGRVAGLFVRTDNAHGGYPFDPIANQPILGLAGLSRDIPFSLLDGSTEGQQMLASNIAVVEQGAVGIDGAISEGGFYFIGTDNAATPSASTMWSQIHQVRGTDYIVTDLMAITRQYLGLKITADMAEAWINSLDRRLSFHEVNDHILGRTPKAQMFKPDQNDPANIRLGTLSLSIGVEAAPAFKLANHNITKWAPALDGLVADIVARLAA